MVHPSFVCIIDIFAQLEQTLRKLKETYLQLGKYQTNFSCAICAIMNKCNMKKGIACGNSFAVDGVHLQLFYADNLCGCLLFIAAIDHRYH